MAVDLLQRAVEELDRGHAAAAAAILQRAFPRANSSVAHLTVASAVYQALGKPDQAAYFARQATRVAPHEPDLWANLGLVLFGVAAPRADAVREAEAAYRKALSLGPASANTVTGLANLLLHQKRYAEGEEVCRTAGLAATPALATTYASLLAALWRSDEAVAVLRHARDLAPNDPGVLQALIVNLQVTGTASPDGMAALHRELGAVIERDAPTFPRRALATEDRSRRLIVGFMSPDLRRHSVAYFVGGLFKHLDRAEFRVHAYSTSPYADEVTAALRRSVDTWVDASLMGDQALAEQVAKDKVDVLVDLAGLSQGGRLGVLARKPAPVQVTYCGYPDTTGLAAVDVRVVDGVTDPEGGADRRAAERLVRVDPCFLCYEPPEDAPDVAVRDPGSPITFASFNAIRKVNARTMDLWSSVLERVPGSQLLIKSQDLDVPEVAARLRAEIARRGISGRVHVLRPAASVREHLAQYGGVDVALDPFPYHGTTTTCEALWMGVPVVTLTGATHASRVSTSLLHAIGCGAWAAQATVGYREVAAGLVSDRTALAALRCTLRDRVRSSPLCDRERFAKVFGSALRQAWVEVFEQ